MQLLLTVQLVPFRAVDEMHFDLHVTGMNELDRVCSANTGALI